MNEFSWFNKNNSSTIKDMKNLSKKMNCTGLITPWTKFEPSPLQDERKHLFLVSSYGIVKQKTLVPNILSTPTVNALKQFLNWSRRELSEKVSGVLKKRNMFDRL